MIAQLFMSLLLGQMPSLVEEAKKEGVVVVYSTTDTSIAEPLLKDFKELYPTIRVEYNDLNSTELYNRYVSEVAAKATTADVVWSSAMDLQVKLVEEGHALTYVSPEAVKLPSWAVWKNQAYGTTFEPVSFVYNKRLMAAGDVPKTHAELAKVLANPKFKGKTLTYDPERSGLGFLLLTQDLKYQTGFSEMVKAFGVGEGKVYTSTGAMLEKISSGEALIGFNMLGSYALARSKRDPSIGFVNPTDYCLVISRVMFIAKTAVHVNAAKLWLDYILSERGQRIIAEKSLLFSIRNDIEGENTAVGLSKTLGTALKPIPINPEILDYLNQTKRLDFLKSWQAAIKK